MFSEVNHLEIVSVNCHGGENDEIGCSGENKFGWAGAGSTREAYPDSSIETVERRNPTPTKFTQSKQSRTKMAFQVTSFFVGWVGHGGRRSAVSILLMVQYVFLPNSYATEFGLSEAGFNGKQKV